MGSGGSGLLDSTTPERQLPRYRVRQWTNFPFEDKDEKTNQDREENLERTAAALEDRLRNKCAHYDPYVKRVRVERRPQLLFEMTVPAKDEDDATRKVRYWMKRAFATTRKVRVAGRMRNVSPSFPIGRVEVRPDS